MSTINAQSVIKLNAPLETVDDDSAQPNLLRLTQVYSGMHARCDTRCESHVHARKNGIFGWDVRQRFDSPQILWTADRCWSGEVCRFVYMQSILK